MKRILTPEIVDQLEGRAIRLSSPYAEGQLLSVSPQGKISLEPQKTKGVDQYWELIPIGEGFEIVSAKFGFKVCHHLKNGGVVSTIEHGSADATDCVWKLTEEGEIYQEDPQGGERYLWLAGGRLYATRDGFLAEKWAPYLFGEKLPSPVGPQYNKFLILIVLAILVVFFMM